MTTHFDPQALLAQASQAAGGLTDFGDPSFRGGLHALCSALDKEARLSEMGADILRQKIVGQLITRLRVEDYFRRYPEIADEQITPPLVIVGVPRTGTTKLHRLLSRDPRFYWMSFWESQFPVPFPDESLNAPTSRIREAHAMVDMMTQAMPKLTAIHPMDAEAADEEVMLTEQSFLSAFDAYADIPSYVAWLDQQDQTPTYRYLRRMLQFLQWQKRQRGVTAQRWVLKSPHHLMRMRLLLEMFPNAKVILTHRDPLQSIPSIASFIHTLWCIYSEQTDPKSAGHAWSERMRQALKHTMEFRQHAPPQQFMDVQFVDTVRKPMAVVKRVYDFIGWDLPADVEQAMRDWLKDDQHKRNGGHDYTAEQFGLSETQLERDFAEYRQRHIQTHR